MTVIVNLQQVANERENAHANADAEREYHRWVQTLGPTAASATILALADRLSPDAVREVVQRLAQSEPALSRDHGLPADDPILADDCSAEFVGNLALALPQPVRHRLALDLIRRDKPVR